MAGSGSLPAQVHHYRYCRGETWAETEVGGVALAGTWGDEGQAVAGVVLHTGYMGFTLNVK